MPESEERKQGNIVASIFKLTAWILFIGGFFAGAVFGNVEVGTAYYSDKEFSLAVALVYWFSAFVGGSIFLGFAEIIKLLEAIKNK